MLNVEKWAQDKNPLLAFCAIYHALTARMKSDALRHIKERRIYNHHFPLPDLQQWFSMYTSRKPLFAYKRLIAGSSELTDKQIDFYQGLRQLDKIFQKHPESLENVKITADEINESLELWRGMLGELFDEIRGEIAQKSLTDEMQARLDTAVVKDELPLGFYMLVYASCQTFYQTSPTKLYRQALAGDVPAIEKLLKIDPLILHDPAIGYQIQSVRLHGKANEYERIIDAITKQPRINYKQLSDERRSIKSDHGGLILHLFTAFKHSLKAPDVRELFDCLATDYDGELIDTDIKKPAGFDKTVLQKAAHYKKQRQLLEKQK